MSQEHTQKPDAKFLDSLAQTLGKHSELPEGLESFATALVRRHANAVRVHFELHSSALPFVVSPVQWYSNGYHCESVGVRPSRTLSYARGDFFIQDAGSMLALAACRADSSLAQGRQICDLCAAPGGKASALLESIGDGFLLANEPIKSRRAALEFNLARTGSDRYTISSMDPDLLADQLGGVFDLVLADVPCSGQALLGRGKQSLAAVSPTQVEHSASRARRILSAATRLLRPGGQLVLSTCTFAEAENEAQVRWLVEQLEMVADPVEPLGPYQSDAGQDGCSYRLWPQRHDCAGSFAASLRLDPGIDREPPLQRKKKRLRQKQGDRPPAELSEWFASVPRRIKLGGAVVCGWPDDVPEWVEQVTAAGPELAYRTGQTWKPSHGVALRRTAELRSKAVEIDEAIARHYLAGNPIPLSETGWCVLRSEGRGLGWVKASGGQGKNHLPTAARLDIH